MYDFLRVERKWDNKLQRNVYKPTFHTSSNIKDLLVRGNKFYAIFNYNTNLWETDDPKAIELIDEQVRDYVMEKESAALLNDPEHGPIILRISDQSNKLIREWHSFCEKDYRKEWDSKYQLNQKVVFSNTDVKRSDYATHRLAYPIQECPTPAYDKICSTLYLPSEVEKWEWFIGCALAGEQRKIQKMLVFYGEPGTGKSTIIDFVIAKAIFGGYIEDGGYYATHFEARNLCGNDSFGTDFLDKDAIMCLDGDAEMDMITSKTTLNKIISHESVRVNPKYERAYSTTPNCLMIVGSNEPIQLAPNSGMNRRVIDVRPIGPTSKLPPDEYDKCIEQLEFERSGIAWKCLQTYKRLGRHAYDKYLAEDMLNRTSPFQNFVIDKYMELKDGISLANAYALYNKYAEDCNFKNKMVRHKFRDTLKLYYKFYENSVYREFKPERIGLKPVNEEKVEEVVGSEDDWLKMTVQPSLFDTQYAHCPAQYETDDPNHPLKSTWAKCKSVLSDLDTSKVHYVKVPINLIVIDLDIKNSDGSKSLEKNLEMARKFPPTYAEVSKSGQGIHLHYIYTGGNPEDLSRIYGDNIEVKVFNGGSSLRRMLSICNAIPIAILASGLPLKEKGDDKVLDWEGFTNTKKLKAFIVACLQKKHHGYTRPEINFLKTVLDDWYKSGATYDVRDFEQNIFAFAANSSNSATYCMDLCSQMHLYSKDIETKEIQDSLEYEEAPIIFLDTEISPSYDQAIKMGVELPDWIPKDTPAHFLINWKFEGEDKIVFRMIDPSPEEVEALFKYRIIAYNGRGYDAHMMYARSQGYTCEELFVLSDAIINKKDQNAKFMMAYSAFYADPYEYATNENKIGLKKWEIRLKIRHLEWNRPWDWPVPNADLERFSEYCDNDVIALEKVFNEKSMHAEFLARVMLAKLAGGKVIDTTNKLSTKFVRGDADHLELVYTDFTTGKSYGDGVPFTLEPITLEEYERIWRDEMLQEPVNINHFPSYHWVLFPDGTLHNMYRGVDVGRGGLVLANPGMYGRAVTKDVASMHPTSIEVLKLFGKQTLRYSDIKKARICIKHKDFETVKHMFNGVLAPFLEDPSNAKPLAKALKLILNSFYGMTSSPSDYFEAKDPRNVNNIVALRGALVMKTLYDEVTARGFNVIHIKTDSIKIENPTEEILKFVDEFGKKYGYVYEVEHTWDRLCLKDDAQFIGHFADDDPDYMEDNTIQRWEATGKYFAVPYVFKSLFTHEEITLDDMAEVISVIEGTLHLVTNEGYQNEVDEFIGRVGQFTPVTEKGGKLYRVKNGKRYAATGTKGYLWLETNTVSDLHLEEIIDRSYYTSKCDDAVEVLRSFGDIEWFVNVENDITVDNFIDYPNGQNESVEAIPFN